MLLAGRRALDAAECCRRQQQMHLRRGRGTWIRTRPPQQQQHDGQGAGRKALWKDCSKEMAARAEPLGAPLEVRLSLLTGGAAPLGVVAALWRAPLADGLFL